MFHGIFYNPKVSNILSCMQNDAKYHMYATDFRYRVKETQLSLHLCMLPRVNIMIA